MKNLPRPSSHGPIGDSTNKDQTNRKEIQGKKANLIQPFFPSLMKPCSSVSGIWLCLTGKAVLSQSQLVPVLGLVPRQECVAVPVWHSCAATGTEHRAAPHPALHSPSPAPGQHTARLGRAPRQEPAGISQIGVLNSWSSQSCFLLSEHTCWWERGRQTPAKLPATELHQRDIMDSCLGFCN